MVSACSFGGFSSRMTLITTHRFRPAFSPASLLGGHSACDPPDPISNSAVKPGSAKGTHAQALEEKDAARHCSRRKGRKKPIHKSEGCPNRYGTFGVFDATCCRGAEQ